MKASYMLGGSGFTTETQNAKGVGVNNFIENILSARYILRRQILNIAMETWASWAGP